MKTPLIDSFEGFLVHTGQLEKLKTLIREQTCIRADGRRDAYHEAAKLVPLYCKGKRAKDLVAEFEMNERAQESIAKGEVDW